MKQTLYQPARLSDLIGDYSKTLQRHIHTVFIRGVTDGSIRGIKLREKFPLPHCNNPKREVPKTDVGFAGCDVAGAKKLIAQVVSKYEKAPRASSTQPSFDELLEMDHQEYEQLIEMQVQVSRRKK